jgi:hypothetical protein
VPASHHVDGSFRRVATFSSGHVGVMGLEFDREHHNLWAHCDNTCGNRTTLLGVETRPAMPKLGRFDVKVGFLRPGGMSDAMNNEGIAITPVGECQGDLRSVFWSDDGATGGNSIRRGSITCNPLP